MSPMPEAAPPRPPFDRLTIALHWASVLMVLVQFASALSRGAVDPALIPALLLIHRSTGAALWLVVAFRLAWRFTGMRLPPFPPNFTRLHTLGVHLSEYGLYALLLLQPLTGLVMTLAHGRPFRCSGSRFRP